MQAKRFGGFMLVLLLAVCGCIVGDQLTTVTIYPDGSADLTVFRSNLRSTQRGEAAENEVAAYQRQFESQTEGELARVREVGGEVLDTLWIRKEAPMTNVVHARLPDASVLERYWTANGEGKDTGIFTQFERDGVHRRITIHIATSPAEADEGQVATTDVAQIRQANANGISETRIVVVKGSITSARGFTVASDRQSALLNGHEIEEMLREGEGQAELHLAWDVEP